MLICDVLADRVAKRGDHPFILHEGRSVTYGEVAAAASRCGHALAALGVEIEDRVLLVLDDTPAFAAVFWGAVI